MLTKRVFSGLRKNGNKEQIIVKYDIIHVLYGNVLILHEVYDEIR